MPMHNDILDIRFFAFSCGAQSLGLLMHCLGHRKQGEEGGGPETSG